jgi:hypothetical protein
MILGTGPSIGFRDRVTLLAVVLVRAVFVGACSGHRLLDAEPIGHALLDNILGCTLLVHISLARCACLLLLRLLLRLVRLAIIARGPSLRTPPDCFELS